MITMTSDHGSDLQFWVELRDLIPWPLDANEVPAGFKPATAPSNLIIR